MIVQMRVRMVLICGEKEDRLSLVRLLLPLLPFAMFYRMKKETIGVCIYVLVGLIETCFFSISPALLQMFNAASAFYRS